MRSGNAMQIGTKQIPFGYYHFGDKRNCACDADSCATCKLTIAFGKVWYCGFTPPRCSIFDVVKSERIIKGNELWGDKICCTCKHAAKRVSTKVCSECLSTYDAMNYKKSERWIEALNEFKRTHEKVNDSVVIPSGQENHGRIRCLHSHI